MAYEHGSIKLDIDNPFIEEGKLQSLAGVIMTGYGLWLLLGVVDAVAQSRYQGWGQLAVAGLALVIGLRQLGKGLVRVFRFYVGRGVPLSLAPDLSQSNETLQTAERQASIYRPEELESMLLGRKNPTFNEPEGFVARLVHSLCPQLIFLPYAYRNMTTRLAVALFDTVIALLSYGLIGFVTGSGLLTENGELIRTTAQWFILLYLIKTWMNASNLSDPSVYKLEQSGAGSIAKPLVLAVAVPLALGQLLASSPGIHESFSTLTESAAWRNFTGLSPTGYLILLTLTCLVAAMLVGYLLWQRMALADPLTEVSEYREVWQEDVHPRELFITLDTIVLANRRYREIPNRIYKALDPRLKEQADGKGTFSGDILLETQPAPRQLEQTRGFQLVRLVASASGILLVTAGTILLIQQLLNMLPLTEELPRAFKATEAGAPVLLANQATALLGNILTGLIFIAAGRLSRDAAHWFWAELQFDSLLLNFKCNGTFRETRFVTGKGVYDSTQSDNQVIRSDITPWVTLSRIVSSTFAGIGRFNLEGPRLLLEMRQDEQELQSIINELLENLNAREKVASIRNEKDLKAIEKISRVNLISKAQSSPESLFEAGDRPIIPTLHASLKGENDASRPSSAGRPEVDDNDH